MAQASGLACVGAVHRIVKGVYDIDIERKIRMTRHHIAYL